jgi:hypothetical protein
VAGAPGVEPGITGSKPGALPLGYAPIPLTPMRKPSSRHSPYMASGALRTSIGGWGQRMGVPKAPRGLGPLPHASHPEQALLRGSAGPSIYVRLQPSGVWRSLVAHLVRDEGVAGSNPATPTTVSRNKVNDLKNSGRGSRVAPAPGSAPETVVTAPGEIETSAPSRSRDRGATGKLQIDATTRNGDCLKEGVREGCRASERDQESQERAERPAHPSNQLVAQLNERWRVVDDPLQWKLQRKKGNARKKNSGWQDRSFCRTRDGLLRCVREYCGEVDVDALAKLNKLPVWHLDWDRTNLDVPETDHAQSDRQSEPLAAKALEVPDADE